jgi:hypothetical protein
MVMSHGRPVFPPRAVVCLLPSLLLLFSTVSAEVTTKTIQNNSVRNLYLTGQYHYQGALSPEMKDVFSINLIANDSRGREAPLTGDVSVSGKEKYRFKSAKISGDRLTFSTRIIEGISYRFEGRILKVRSATDSYDEPELEGTLTKLRNGEKAGEVKGRFKYEEFGD